MLELIIWIFVLLIIKVLFDKKLRVKRKINRNNNVYTIKSLMTKYERYFYDILVELEDELNIKVIPQVNLASIINKDGNNKYRNELFRNIDFGIFSKDYEDILLLIEINDKTHNSYNRRNRDIKVDKIVSSAGIKLIKFYSNYPNKRDYVKQRIRDELNNR